MNFKAIVFKSAVLTAVIIIVLVILKLTMVRQSDQHHIPITIATIRAPHSGLIQIAEAKGYFDVEGLAATVKTILTGHEAIDEVLNGRADFGGAAETPIAKALGEGKQFRVISTIFYSSRNVAVVARKDHGIVQPVDLKGKRIGVVFGTATHYMLETFLSFYKIPVDSVSLVRTNPNDIVSQLVSGDFDAAVTWTPFLGLMQQQLGDKAQTFYPGEFYAETFNLIVPSDYLAKNYDAANRLFRALLRAELFVINNPDEANEIIAKASKVETNILVGSRDPGAYKVTLNQSVLLATENEAHWYFRRGLIPPATFPDVLNAFDPAPLRAVKPFWP